MSEPFVIKCEESFYVARFSEDVDKVRGKYYIVWSGIDGNMVVLPKPKSLDLLDLKFDETGIRCKSDETWDSVQEKLAGIKKDGGK